MSTIHRDGSGREFMGGCGVYPQNPCCVCGEKPDAIWTGEQRVTICYGCALEVFPALIADAMASFPAVGRGLFLRTRERMLARFDFAAALAMESRASGEGAHWSDLPPACLGPPDGGQDRDAGFSGGPIPAEDRSDVLAAAATDVAACTRCTQLSRCRTQTVFGAGSPTARLMFIGEAPGIDEDRLGQPFVGKAGQLLTDLIEETLGIRRQDVYLANVLKCRPPGNRTPTADEVRNCGGYLERQIEVVRPEVICLLGKTAAMAVLGVDPTALMGHLRGRWHRYRGIPTLVTYHPSYVLRNGDAASGIRGDILMLGEPLGLKVKREAD